MDKKAISGYISHILALGIAFIILGIIASSMYNYYTDILRESQESEAMVLGERVGDQILKMYSKYEKSDVNPGTGNNVTLATSVINTPDSIAGGQYNLHLNSSWAHWIDAEMHSTAEISVLQTRRPTSRVVVEVTGFPSESYIYNLYNIEVNTTGTVERPDNIELRYIRQNKQGNLTDRVTIRRAS